MSLFAWEDARAPRDSIGCASKVIRPVVCSRCTINEVATEFTNLAVAPKGGVGVPRRCAKRAASREGRFRWPVMKLSQGFVPPAQAVFGAGVGTENGDGVKRFWDARFRCIKMEMKEIIRSL